MYYSTLDWAFDKKVTIYVTFLENFQSNNINRNQSKEQKMVLDNETRMKIILERAKKEVKMKEITTFVFSRFFGVLIALFAPFFKKRVK